MSASDYRHCPQCGQYDWMSSHRCPPIWEAWDAREERADSRLVRATSAQGAAERFSQEWHEDEPPSDGDTIRVVVCDPRTGRVTRWSVAASWDVSYHAHDEPDEPGDAEHLG